MIGRTRSSCTDWFSSEVLRCPMRPARAVARSTFRLLRSECGVHGAVHSSACEYAASLPTASSSPYGSREEALFFTWYSFDIFSLVAYTLLFFSTVPDTKRVHQFLVGASRYIIPRYFGLYVYKWLVCFVLGQHRGSFLLVHCSRGVGLKWRVEQWARRKIENSGAYRS